MENPRPYRGVHAGESHGLPADPLLRYNYGGQLEAAAEAFLISAFERATQNYVSEATSPTVLVSAAMHILTRTAWTQPSDEQVKAAMYLNEQARYVPGPGR